MKEILLYNAHLIIDDHKEALNGAILLKGQHIEQVYVAPIKLKNFYNVEAIDVNGAMIFPGFINLKNNALGVTGRIIKKDEQMDNNQDFLGHYLDKNIYQSKDLLKYQQDYTLKLIDFDPNIYINQEYINNVKNKNIVLNVKTLSTSYEDILSLNKECKLLIDNLFLSTPNIGISKPNITNAVLDNNDLYCNYEFNQGFDKTIDRLVLNNVETKYIITNSDNYQNLFKLLNNEYHLDNNKLLMLSSLNKIKLLGLDYLYGTLTRGKFASLVIMNDDYEIKAVINRGVFEWKNL